MIKEKSEKVNQNNQEREKQESIANAKRGKKDNKRATFIFYTFLIDIRIFQKC